VKWAVVRLSDRPRFAIFQLSGTWQASTSPEPDGWMKMSGCRPVFYFQSSLNYAADTSEPTETVWHAVGYPPAERAAVISLHKAVHEFWHPEWRSHSVRTYVTVGRTGPATLPARRYWKSRAC